MRHQPAGNWGVRKSGKLPSAMIRAAIIVMLAIVVDGVLIVWVLPNVFAVFREFTGR